MAHQLPRDPRRVFDAPIFHPERRTLAYSEPLLAPGAMAMPLRAAGLSATATYNLLALAGFALSAWAMWRLVAGWTGDSAAGAVAGCAFAFNAHLLTRFAHLQALHAEFVPIVLLGADRLVTRARWRDAGLLAAGLVLVGLDLDLSAGVRGRAPSSSVSPRGSPSGAAIQSAPGRLVSAGAGLGALCLAPVLAQYWLVNREVGFERTLADAAQYGASWRDYLATGGRLHYALWSAPFFPGSAVLFPGPHRAGPRRARRRRGPAAIAAACACSWPSACLGVAFSFGPALPLYGWLFEAVPLLRAIRVAARWGVLFLTAVAVLAGFGAAALRARVDAADGRGAGLAAAGAGHARSGAHADGVHADAADARRSTPVWRRSPTRCSSSFRCSPARSSTSTRRTCWPRRCTSIRSSPATAALPRRPTRRGRRRWAASRPTRPAR